jgi:NTE family protein
VKTALVLSAGGMFGAYQAGVWKALQPVFRPDVVIGCSVGSINGWAIASGIPGDELIRTWLDPRCATLMTPRVPWRPWRAIFDPGPLQQMVQELTSTYTPHVPFAVAVTRLPQLRLEIVQTPDLTWRHVMASCAVPFGYPPVRIDGHLYCDGGLLSVMPVWAAQRFGVDPCDCRQRAAQLAVERLAGGRPHGAPAGPARAASDWRRGAPIGA